MSHQSHQPEEWEKEFERRFGSFWTGIGNKLYHAFPYTNETPVLVSQESIKSFISSLLTQARKEERERAMTTFILCFKKECQPDTICGDGHLHLKES